MKKEGKQNAAHIVKYIDGYAISATGHILVYNSGTFSKKKDKKHSKKESKRHYVHYTEGTLHEREEKKKIAQEEILKEAIAFFSQEGDSRSEARDRREERPTSRRRSQIRHEGRSEARDSSYKLWENSSVY